MIARAVLWVPVAVIVSVAMDLWAALLHGQVWHRWLWKVHRSHHRPRRGRFEANDALSALHTPLAIALILHGCRGEPGALREIAFGCGVGMTLFGFAYVVVHDGVVHGRLPVGGLARVPWLCTIARAHRVHHLGKGGVPYGLFLGPFELARHRSLRPWTTTKTARRPPPIARQSKGRGPS